MAFSILPLNINSVSSEYDAVEECLNQSGAPHERFSVVFRTYRENSASGAFQGFLSGSESKSRCLFATKFSGNCSI